MIVALTRHHWADLLAVSDMSGPVRALETALDADFTNEDQRYEYREVLAGLFARWFAHRDIAEVRRALSATSLLWSQYRSFAEAVEDNRSNPLMSVIQQEGVGPLMAPGIPLRLRATTQTVEPAPRLGHDTDAVLTSWLGLDATTITGLHERGVIAGEGPQETDRSTDARVVSSPQKHDQERTSELLRSHA